MKPKAPFFIVLFIVVLALLGYAFRGVLFPEGSTGGGGSGEPIDADDLAGGAPAADVVEADDANVPTTVQEYAYVPSEKLPPVKEKSDYQPLADRTVKFALNVWAGWAPIILQNGGSSAGQVWTTPGGEDFKVEC